MSESKAGRLRRQAEQREDAALEAARLQAAAPPVVTRTQDRRDQPRARRGRHQDDQEFRAGMERLKAREITKEPS